MDYQKEIARALLEIGAVVFRPKDPFTFKMGMIVPLYVDNRIFPYFPEHFKLVIEAFAEKIEKDNIDFDVLAGIAVGGIPHSATLGYRLQKPSVFVRKESKGYGKNKRVEGGEVKEKKILLIEDLVSTGSSSLSGVRALREEGAVVDNCIIIVNYDFPESKENFEKEKVTLHALTNFPTIFQEAVDMKIINDDVKKVVEDWYADPWGWAGKHGFDKSRNT